ncbi:hypothetical protein BJ878DRAFT_574309 [Calycina marina]|uniref:Uncharacterized protein n=1 Tax=Calycina marina TaxID=1763456 RepID=A0A9P7Z5R5_9HELO|nr:hypothetical protein BJ878DRAFT_574309 [Calycina marina]
MDGSGDAWIAGHRSGVVEVDSHGNQNIVNDMVQLLTATNGVFGRGSAKESRTLYVTNGGERVSSGEVASMYRGDIGYQTPLCICFFGDIFRVVRICVLQVLEMSKRVPSEVFLPEEEPNNEQVQTVNSA